MIPQCYFSFDDFPCMRQVPPKKMPMQQMQMPMDMNMPMQDQTGGQMPSQPPATQFSDNFVEAPGSPTVLGPEYTQGYLKTIVGRRVRVVFLLGTNTLQDRTGTLTDVGISYIILKEEETNLEVLCDIYSIKFVNIFPK